MKMIYAEPTLEVVEVKIENGFNNSTQVWPDFSGNTDGAEGEE